jgi:adenylate cyclase
MESDRLPRKLAAILYADVVGYSRLTGEDEDATHRTLRQHLDLISSTVEEHGGQVIHYAGDAVLARFGAVLDAMSAAVGIQSELKVRNEGLPNARKLLFRVGVNSGDVIEDRGDIYGDGVNVAARLESLAEPGGICISDAVRTAVGKKLGFHYEDMGAQEVKNIAEPVRSFHVRFQPDEQGELPGRATSSAASAASVPTVAVMPFRFMGNAGEHEYIAPALTESIGSALAHFREYRIVDGDNAGGVTYVLSGTLQIAGANIRISLQLGAGGDGRKLWAQKFDRKLDDVFELQDEISAIVAAYLGEAIWQETARTLVGKNKSDFAAIDWCYYAMGHIHRLTQADFTEVKAACNQAMALDAELLLPKFLLAFTLAIELGWQWAANVDETRTSALALMQELLSKDPANANTHRVAARIHSALGRHAEALTHSERMLTLNPYDGDCLVMHGMTLTQAGRVDEAIPWIEKALRCNPQPPAYYRQALVLAQLLCGDARAALENLRRVEGRGTPLGPFTSIATLHLNGCHDEAAEKVDALVADHPDASVQRAALLFSSYQDSARVKAILDALRDAGLPEEGAGSSSRDP